MVTIGTKENDAMLRTPCKEVTEINDDIKQLVADMHVAVKDYDGIGLAAPQVGYSLRVFIVYLKGEFVGEFINAEIIETSEETNSFREGCLSIPGVFEDVIRPERIRVQYQTLDGKRKVMSASGLLARVIQHETDHINGHVYTDRLSKEKEKQTLDRYARKQKSKRKLLRKKR